MKMNVSLFKYTIVTNTSYKSNHQNAKKILSKKFYKARMTIRLVVLLLESSFVELLQTESTLKVFRVKLAVHGRDASTGDGLLAAST